MHPPDAPTSTTRRPMSPRPEPAPDDDLGATEPELDAARRRSTAEPAASRRQPSPTRAGSGRPSMRDRGGREASTGEADGDGGAARRPLLPSSQSPTTAARTGRPADDTERRRLADRRSPERRDRRRRRADGPSTTATPRPTTARPPGATARSHRRTVAELIAATLRAAGVRIAFTVPGESFLGALEALVTAGIRVVATRHEGGAAFMAEAYGQLTGRPAVCLGTRAVGAANLAIGIHTASGIPRRCSSSSARSTAGSAGARRSRRSTSSTPSAGLGDLGRGAHGPRNARPTSLDEASADRATVARDPSSCRYRRTCSMTPLPDGTSVPTVRPRPPRPDARRGPRGAPPARRCRAAGDPRRGRRAACPVLNDLVQLAELLQVPVIAVVAPRRRLPQRPSAVPRHDRLRRAARRCASGCEAADALLVLGSRLNEIATYELRHPGARPARGCTSTSSRAPTCRGSPRAATRAHGRCPSFLRPPIERLKDGGPLAEPLQARAATTGDRAAWEAAAIVDDAHVVRSRRASRAHRRGRSGGSCRTRSSRPMPATSALGRARLPVPAARHFLGPTSGAMGYGLPAAIAAGLARRERPSSRSSATAVSA